MSEADKIYVPALRKFTKIARRCFEASINARNVDAGPQRYWASVIFTRICSLSANLILLCPGSVLNPRGLNWDFESIAALSRSVFEAILMLLYLGLEKLSADEWNLRINLVHLADCTERIRLFQSLGSDNELARLVPTAYWLRSQLEANSIFQALPEKLRKELRTGEKATLFGKGEIIARAQEDPIGTLDFYRFISNYIHYFPMGFHRTAMHQRIGTENDVDKGYAGLALDFASRWLEKAVSGFEAAFADLATFGKGSFDFAVLTKPSGGLSERDEALYKQRILHATAILLTAPTEGASSRLQILKCIFCVDKMRGVPFTVYLPLLASRCRRLSLRPCEDFFDRSREWLFCICLKLIKDEVDACRVRSQIHFEIVVGFDFCRVQI